MRVTIRLGAYTALLTLAACNQDTATTPADARPAGGQGGAAAAQNWLETVTATADGGILLGNPNAPVKLVEFASFTCPHCADFSNTAGPLLKEQYVKTGKVAWELRNFVRDPVDLTAALLARCGGTRPAFKLSEQMFEQQEAWLGRFQQQIPANEAKLNALGPAARLAEIAKLAGLDQFVRARGITTARADACLADTAQQTRLAEMRGKAVEAFDITGTPSFVINGTKADGVYDWTTLKPRLDEALGN